MAKTVNSDIWPLYKGSIIFLLIPHDTGKNKSVYIFFQNKKQCCDKTTHIENILRNDLKWSLVTLYRWSLYREKFDLKI